MFLRGWIEDPNYIDAHKKGFLFCYYLLLQMYFLFETLTQLFIILFRRYFSSMFCPCHFTTKKNKDILTLSSDSSMIETI